jgi:hypothetical protein
MSCHEAPFAFDPARERKVESRSADPTDVRLCLHAMDGTALAKFQRLLRSGLLRWSVLHGGWQWLISPILVSDIALNLTISPALMPFSPPLVSYLVG